MLSRMFLSEEDSDWKIHFRSPYWKIKAVLKYEVYFGGNLCEMLTYDSFSLFVFKTSKNQIKVDLVDENFTELRGEIAGPPDTPYEGK